MGIRIPDLLARELRHSIEGLGDGVHRLGLAQWIRESRRLVIGVTCLLALLLAVVAVSVLRRTPEHEFQQGKMAWFYDVNTGRLFSAAFRHVGPVAAPSGPTRGGKPGGFRAHVYSYVLDPNEDDLIVGFLEQPDPDAPGKASASDMTDLNKWTQSRLIRRVKDKQWVQAASPEGQAILDELMRPNEKGQIPVWHTPR